MHNTACQGCSSHHNNQYVGKVSRWKSKTPVLRPLPAITDWQSAQVVLRSIELTVLQRHETERQHISAALARMSSVAHKHLQRAVTHSDIMY
jgi:hypothetical protein